MKNSKKFELKHTILDLYEASKSMVALRDAALKGGSQATIFHTREYEDLVEATACFEKLIPMECKEEAEV